MRTLDDLTRLAERLPATLLVPRWDRGLGAELAALLQDQEDGTATVVLLPARTETRWWWGFAPGRPQCFLRGRLRFPGKSSGAPFPSAAVYLGRDEDAFVRLFSEVGWCVYRDGRIASAEGTIVWWDWQNSPARQEPAA